MLSYRHVNITTTGANQVALPANPRRVRLIITVTMAAANFLAIQFGRAAASSSDGLLIFGSSHPGYDWRTYRGDVFVRESVNIFGSAAGDFVGLMEVVEG